MSAEQIEHALYDAYGSRQVSTIYTPTNQYWVVMELLPEFQTDMSALDLLYVRSRSGASCRSSSVTTTADGRPADREPHRPAAGGDDLLRPAPGVSLGDAVDEVRERGADVLPDGVVTGFSGDGAGVPGHAAAGSGCCSSSRSS